MKTLQPRVRTLSVVFLGGLLLGIVTLLLATWLALLNAKGEPKLATLRSIDQQIWRHLHNHSTGVEWVALSDWGQDLVNEGPAFDEVELWARPQRDRPADGNLRSGTIRAGWPLPWCGASWTSDRRDESWPPYPFDEDLGYGFEDACENFLEWNHQPQGFITWSYLWLDLLVLSLPWWALFGFVSYRGVRVGWGDKPEALGKK